MDLFGLTKLVAGLILPPAGPLILAFIGLLAARRWRRFGSVLVALSIGALTLLTMPVVATSLMAAVEKYAAFIPSTETVGDAGAIVVLGGGRYADAPEYGGNDTVSSNALVRLRYGARLHRQTGLPLLVTGGVVFPSDQVPESVLMAEVLEKDLSAPARWTEQRSRNTAENASYTAEILFDEGIRHIILVTHSSHMRRSVDAFAKEGFSVTPAPTALLVRSRARELEFRDLIPQAWALKDSRTALHEFLGILWYQMRY